MKTPRWIFGVLVTLSLAGLAFAGSFQQNENEHGKDNNKEKQESPKKEINPAKNKAAEHPQQRDKGRQQQANVPAKQDQHPEQQRQAQPQQR
jgi:Tfp pilus assembly protein PilO